MPSPARLESGSGSREQEWIADEPEVERSDPQKLFAEGRSSNQVPILPNVTDIRLQIFTITNICNLAFLLLSINIFHNHFEPIF
jgi:hypothetical protein